MEEKTLKNILEEDPTPKELQKELEDVEKLAKALEPGRKMDFSLGRMKGTIEHHVSHHSLDPERAIIRIINVWNYRHMADGSDGYSEDYSLPGYDQVWMSGIPDNEGNFAEDWFFGWRKEILIKRP